MKLRDHIKLIPRNNWDYGFKALLDALAGAGNNAAQAPNTENIFQKNPIWTKSGRTSLYAILKSLGTAGGCKDRRSVVLLFCSFQCHLSGRLITSISRLKHKRL